MLLKPQPQFVVYWVVQAKGVQNSVLVYIYCGRYTWYTGYTKGVPGIREYTRVYQTSV